MIYGKKLVYSNAEDAGESGISAGLVRESGSSATNNKSDRQSSCDPARPQRCSSRIASCHACFFIARGCVIFSFNGRGEVQRKKLHGISNSERRVVLYCCDHIESGD
jgi:hypothetical protein